MKFGGIKNGARHEAKRRFVSGEKAAEEQDESDQSYVKMRPHLVICRLWTYLFYIYAAASKIRFCVIKWDSRLTIALSFGCNSSSESSIELS